MTLVIKICLQCFDVDSWASGRANDLHMAQLMPLSPIISCFSKIQNGFTFLVLAYPGCPGKMLLNGHSVVVAQQQ